MFYILSDILHSTAHSQCAMMYGIIGAWLSSPRTFIGSWSAWGLSHCGIVPLWGLIRLLLGFPSTDIILPLWCKTKWCVYEFFHQCHVPLRHGIVGARKPSPQTFIGQWAVEHIPHYVLWGMVVCLFVGIVFYLLAYVIIIQSGGGKSNKKICFNIF